MVLQRYQPDAGTRNLILTRLANWQMYLLLHIAINTSISYYMSTSRNGLLARLWGSVASTWGVSVAVGYRLEIA